MASKSTSNPVSSRTAYIDPETGELTSKPAAEDINGEARFAEVGLPPVKVTEYADGTVGVALNGRFSTPLTAKIAGDGSIIQEHSQEIVVNAESHNETNLEK